MSTDLIALGVAIALGIAVIVVGLRRNLSETTRNGLPRFGTDPEGATATLGLYEGEERPRRRPSRQERLRLASFVLLIAVLDAALAALSADDRLLHAGTAALLALGALFQMRRAGETAIDV